MLGASGPDRARGGQVVALNGPCEELAGVQEGNPCSVLWFVLILTNWQQTWPGYLLCGYTCANGGANHGTGLWDQCL